MAKAEFQMAVEQGTAAASTWLDEICSLRLALRDPWFRLEDFVASARAIGAADSGPSGADLALAPIPESQGNTENRVPCDSGIVEADKQADIERRASMLQPPIPLDTLRGLPAFQTALQVPQPLDNASWGQLLPRLLAQMEPAQDEPVKQGKQDAVVLTGANDDSAGVPTSMFAYIIIQQIAVQFAARFPKPITIGMMKNAFTVYKRLRDARELTEIHAHCRQCFFSEQTYSLSALTTHFQEQHSMPKHMEDWPSMMINPPRSNAISEMYARLLGSGYEEMLDILRQTFPFVCKFFKASRYKGGKNAQQKANGSGTDGIGQKTNPSPAKILHPMSANSSAEKRQAETPMQRNMPLKKIKTEPSDTACVPRPRSDGTSVAANEPGSEANDPDTTGSSVPAPNCYNQQAGSHEIAGQPIHPVLGHWQPQFPPATPQEAFGSIFGQPVNGEATPLGRRFNGVYYYTIPPQTNLPPYNGPWY
ncbi:hypothetical protein K4F52_001119 [Lecanicillium sp. MT-2017a]|nr:hypothetical protein K4F52_001119 [Lecanicillium sp. MT-2017a]